MWDPRSLTTLLVSTACYRDSFIFYSTIPMTLAFSWNCSELLYDFKIISRISRNEILKSLRRISRYKPSNCWWKTLWSGTNLRDMQICLTIFLSSISPVLPSFAPFLTSKSRIMELPCFFPHMFQTRDTFFWHLLFRMVWNDMMSLSRRF
jgi:hypothetical protein